MSEPTGARLMVRAAAGLVFLLAVLAAALFVPAGTLDYWQAWIWLGVFAAGVIAITIDLARRDPALLARRVKAGPVAEPTAAQKLIQSLASVAFLAIFVVSARAAHRVDAAWSIAGDALVVLGLAVVAWVFRANTFTSATIEVAREQQLVSTGPYAIVRHPMYAGALVLLAGTPPALGSWWGEVAVIALVAVIAWRLLDEERVLAADLAGYAEYRQRVRHRLLPYVW